MTRELPDPTDASPADGGPTAAGVPAAPGRRSGRLLVGVAGLLAVAAVAAGSTVYVRSSADAATPGPARATAAARAVPAPTVALSGAAADGSIPWSSPLTLAVTDGTLEQVTGTGPEGVVLTGDVGPAGTWSSSTPLWPSTTYALVADVRDAAGRTRSLPLSATTAAPQKTLGVTLLPGDDAVVGVGQALAVRLGTPVTDKAVRAEVERRLTVTTVPAQPGSWRWTSSRELRYRGPEFWAAGTRITLSAALAHLQAAPGVWGTGTRTSTFTVGDALTAVVDTRAHTMVVSRNGAVVRTMKASMGKPQFATRNGTFVVLEKFADRVMDSATVDLPPGTPAYRTAVKDAVRITNSGTFTHGAPWSVKSQGVANVSHGCINLSPVDADWYFHQAKRGDVVTVVGSTVGPSLSDAGSQDWNLTYDQWRSGSALG